MCRVLVVSLLLYHSFDIISTAKVPYLKTQYWDRLELEYSGDALLDFTGLAEKYVKAAEAYDVTTEDGYILKVFRVPGNVSKTVLISHGIFITSDDYIIRGKISLIYMLAKQGFDIWAMNFRGSRYSRRHLKLNPDTDEEFWEYSMHEMGIYDYRATIDFILNKTGQDRLSVIGHSGGTSAFFTFASERPEYNDKTKVFVGLSPACYLQHAGLLVTGILKLSPFIEETLEALGIQEFIGYYSFSKKAIDAVCSHRVIGYRLCFSILGIASGFNPNNIETDFMKTILGHYPAGTSKRNLEHYGHIYHHNKFVQFDYGENNYAVYGSSMPPVYDLKKVTVKTALFVGKGDKVIGIEDVLRLKNDLPNVVNYHLVSDEEFNHLDFVWGWNAHIVLYPYVIDVLLKYND